jgi:cation:H+ antiporter
MIEIYIFLFLFSLILMHLANKSVLKSLNNVAKMLSLREFVIAFFIMAIAGSLPNLFLGVISALKKIPELSLGDIIGGNIVDLSLTIAIAGLIAKEGIPSDSRMVQKSSLFTAFAAILPLFLMFDGVISRFDGFILIFAFFLYVYWLFSDKERFTKVYDEKEIPTGKLFFELIKVTIGIFLILFSSIGIVKSAQFFHETFNASLGIIGLLIVGLANCLPEAAFSFMCAFRNETWMILGDLMGAIIVPATLVLGIVAMICPINVVNLPSFAVARIFLLISAIFFYFFNKTGHKITKKESVLLFFTYILFIAFEILISF